MRCDNKKRYQPRVALMLCPFVWWQYGSQSTPRHSTPKIGLVSCQLNEHREKITLIWKHQLQDLAVPGVVSYVSWLPWLILVLPLFDTFLEVRLPVEPVRLIHLLL